jgi:hypothetical protein
MSDNGQQVPLPGCMIGPSEPCDAFQRQTARLAVEQDRAQREKREPHRALLALQKDGYVDVNSDDDHAQHLIVLRWTPKRVWIESEKNRELARILRKHYYNSELAFDVADDLDGGKR